MTKIAVNAEILEWAARRARPYTAKLYERFPLQEWIDGKRQPTAKQLDKFAKAACIPFGFLFLPKPIEEPLPIHDLRPKSDRAAAPTVDLLETIYLCQRRQAWFEEYAERNEEVIDWSTETSANPSTKATANQLRKRLDLPRNLLRLPVDSAFTRVYRAAENAGVLVMRNSVVQCNNLRRLDPEEFSAVVLSSQSAPLVFLNSSLPKVLQLIALSTGLACLSQNQSGLLTPECAETDEWVRSIWKVAANLLQHRTAPSANRRPKPRPVHPTQQAALAFLKYVRKGDREVFQTACSGAMAGHQIARQQKRGGGGDFYKTLRSRLGARFSLAVLRDACTDDTTQREALSLLGLREWKQAQTFLKKLEPADR
jgi:hypothetical protein